MFEEAFLKIGERIGSLRVTVIAAFAFAAATLAVLFAAGAYIWFHPLALCRQQTSSLFFGTAIGGDGQVEAADWSRFVDDAILPRFPDGFTILDGQGIYRAAGAGAMREGVHVLVLAHAKSVEIDGKLDAIAEEYKTRFHQESVLRLDQCGAYRF